MSDRAIVFIDGNNWFHSLGPNGIGTDLDYSRISRKLLGPRTWVGTRYYIGSLKHYHRDFDAQRRFLSKLQNQSPEGKITVRYGRIEDHKSKNPIFDPLSKLIEEAPARASADFLRELRKLAEDHRNISEMKEKAADVFLAVDLCTLATADEYDSAYLLSADGDFTPAVEFARKAGKKVYVASPASCFALSQAANSYIQLPKDWFKDCRLP